MKFRILFILALAFFSTGFAQNIGIYLKPVNITGLSGTQSFAVGHYNNYWLIVGGRKDGLHRRQPFAAFDTQGQNDVLEVVDISNKTVFASAINTLPIAIQEQVRATNTQFYQAGDLLYIIGGYGYSASANEFVTHDKLLIIELSGCINAIKNNVSILPYFHQTSNAAFAVTGGQLKKIYDDFYLVGGQYFEGAYNPMGPTHGPGFIQRYSNGYTKMKLSYSNNTINYTIFPKVVDSISLHRRDFNVASQIFANKTQGLTAFSGVFQEIADIPYLNSVNIDSNGYAVNNNFSQYYNHYHCADLPLYSASNDEMHTIFFGGIAQYYDSTGILVQDNNVPFVKTISQVTRNNSTGAMKEYKLPVDMPDYLGAGAEFIHNINLPEFENGVLKLDSLVGDTVLLGHIIGGIKSTARNIFFSNTGTQSSAYTNVLEVYMVKNTTNSSYLNEQSANGLALQVFPNPNEGDFNLKFNLKQNSDVQISIYTLKGKRVAFGDIKNLPAGEHIYKHYMKKLDQGGTYILTVTTNYTSATQKVIIAP